MQQDLCPISHFLKQDLVLLFETFNLLIFKISKLPCAAEAMPDFSFLERNSVDFPEFYFLSFLSAKK